MPIQHVHPSGPVTAKATQRRKAGVSRMNSWLSPQLLRRDLFGLVMPLMLRAREAESTQTAFGVLQIWRLSSGAWVRAPVLFLDVSRGLARC